MILKEVPLEGGPHRLICADRSDRVEKAAKDIEDAGFEIQVSLVKDTVTISIRHAEKEYEVANAAAPNTVLFLKALDATVLQYADRIKSVDTQLTT